MLLNHNRFRVLYVAAREASLTRVSGKLFITPQATKHAIRRLGFHFKAGLFQ